MLEARVTKYDPRHRVNGAFTRDEWTSIADVGKRFGQHIFTMADYVQAEQRHVDFLCALVEKCGAFPLRVNGYDVNYRNDAWKDGQEIQHGTLPDIIRANLREECWCRLVGKGFFIHFGYDYYMYVGCELTFEVLSTLAEKHGLFCEAFRSPYHDEEEDACISAP